MVVVVVVVMAVNTVVDHLDELFFEKQLLLDGQFCKPYPVAHVKFRRVQVPGWLNQGLSMSTFVRTREMVVNYAREG